MPQMEIHAFGISLCLVNNQQQNKVTFLWHKFHNTVAWAHTLCSSWISVMCYECMWGIIQGAELDIIPVRATTGYQQRHQITMEQTFFFLLIPTPLEAPFGNLILAS